MFFVLFYSLVIGAFLSVIKMIYYHSFNLRLSRLKAYVKGVINTGIITPYYDRKKDGDSSVIPFGVAIGFGTLVSMIGGL